MTTKAQLRKSALGLPGAEEDVTAATLMFRVEGKTFAELTSEGLVSLKLNEETVRASLEHCSITKVPTADGEPAEVAVPLADVNGMELNNLVFKSWLTQASPELAAAARAAVKGEAPAGPDALPTAIGKPATRALLLAGISTLSQVAQHTEAELLELHGVGPRALKILGEALRGSSRRFR